MTCSEATWQWRAKGRGSINDISISWRREIKYQNNIGISVAAA